VCAKPTTKRSFSVGPIGLRDCSNYRTDLMKLMEITKDEGNESLFRRNYRHLAGGVIKYFSPTMACCLSPWVMEYFLLAPIECP